MRLHKRLVYSFVIALIVFFLSLATTIIPCQTAPNIPNPQYSWSMCTLNPDITSNTEHPTTYLGISTSLTQSYVLVLGITFIIAFIILSLVFKVRKQ